MPFDVGPLLSIVIPTIRGREHWLRECIKRFERHTPVDFEILIEHDHEVCGTAWNAGIARARGFYVLIAADDLYAMPGWFDKAIARVSRYDTPAAVVLNPNMTVQSCGHVASLLPDGFPTTISRVPFATREQMLEIGEILPIHYATDNWWSHRAGEIGLRISITHGFTFIHHFAMEGRIDERVMDDVRVFWEAAGLEGEPTPAAL